MGFLDKAKKLADQAQSKLDEVQKDFTAKQSSGEGGSAPVEYDQHGRPVVAPEPVGAPVPEAPAAPAPPADKSPTIDPGSPAASADAEPAKKHGDPLVDDEPGSRHGPAPSSGSGLSSGDPLAG